MNNKNFTEFTIISEDDKNINSKYFNLFNNELNFILNEKKNNIKNNSSSSESNTKQLSTNKSSSNKKEIYIKENKYSNSDNEYNEIFVSNTNLINSLTSSDKDESTQKQKKISIKKKDIEKLLK